MLFTGRKIKTVPEVLGTARSLRPGTVLKTEGTVSSNTDRPKPANNVFILFHMRMKATLGKKPTAAVTGRVDSLKE